MAVGGWRSLGVRPGGGATRGIELAFDDGPVTLATADPSLLWPFDVERASVTPTFLVTPESWPGLLRALDIEGPPPLG
jgi:hypothetical protein